MNTRIPRIILLVPAVAVIVLLVAVVLGGCAPLVDYDGETTGCTVTGKYTTIETDSEGHASTVKRVETTCGVFEVADNLFEGQWNSADIYASLQEGKTYDFEAKGYRNGFFSLFPNIVRATEVTA